MGQSISSASITLCDFLNPGFGYSVVVRNAEGTVILHTSKDPITGTDLLTFGDAVNVVTGYCSRTGISRIVYTSDSHIQTAIQLS